MRLTSVSLGWVFPSSSTSSDHLEVEHQGAVGRDVVVGDLTAVGEHAEGGGEAEEGVLELVDDSELGLEGLELLLELGPGEGLLALADPLVGLGVGRGLAALLLDEGAEQVALVETGGGELEEVVDRGALEEGARVGAHLAVGQVGLGRGHHTGDGRVEVIGAGVLAAQVGQGEGEDVVLPLEVDEEVAADRLEADGSFLFRVLLGHG